MTSPMKRMPKFPTPSGIGLQDRRNDPYHDPMHNIVVPHKGKASIKCLTCGTHVRFGEMGESPAKDKDELGGVRPKRWFCSDQCFKYYVAYTGGQVKSRDEAILGKLMKDYTGGASPLGLSLIHI